MIEIRSIQPNEVTQAKHLIYEVAFQIFHDEIPLEQGIPYYESRGELCDMDDIQGNYFDNGGVFLVMAKGEHLLGTGALRRIEDDVCELKRLWLRMEYQGQGYGYRMMQELLAFARAKGYKKMRLQTDGKFQGRAVDFYHRLGFYDIPYDGEDPNDIMMEMEL
jgi:putative acetyltransferase